MGNRINILKGEAVSFSVAELAKEIGFPQDSLFAYKNRDRALCTIGILGKQDVINYTAAPLRSVLQKWLYENGILVWVSPYGISSAQGWAYDVQYWVGGELKYEGYQLASGISLTPDQALEEGFIKGITLIRENEQ